MAGFVALLGLTLLWTLLTGSFRPFDVLVGALLGLLLLSIVERARHHRGIASRLWGVLRFAGRFLVELAVAGVAITRLTLTPRPAFHPHVVAVPLRVESDAAIALLSATITLLPGTVAMGTSQDRRVLYAHAIGESDPERSRASVVRIEDLILGFMK